MPSPGQRIFDAESESLYDFVSKNGRGLYIPPYQREYAWDKSNVERLVDDTIQGINSLIKRPDESITFIGTVIAMADVKKTTISPLVKNQVYERVMSIIDGQQRLTTLLMLCLSLLLEIEVQWADLNSKKLEGTDEARSWLEARVNNMRGLLSQMLSERQNNGEGEYKHFPKMIRAFVDTWSYEADKAKYYSPIAWLLFEFVRFREQANPNWAKFQNFIKQNAEGVPNDAQRRHFVKIIKVMRERLHSLLDDDEFPSLLTVARDIGQQEILFGEEFPDEMRAALEAYLQQSRPSGGDPGGTPTELWWEASAGLICLLIFSKFALERITLVVVTATTEDFAFDVFEALNTTGQPLTALETFIPKVVQAVGMASYNSSDEKAQLDIASSYIGKVSRAEERQKRSADLLVAFALAELGEKRSKNLADQRRFMRDAFDGYTDRGQRQEFIRHLAELAKFFENLWVSNGAKPHVEGRVLSDPAALCMRFLVDFGHTITAPLLAQYVSVVYATADPVARQRAIENFEEVVLAVTAFTVLWRASRSTTDRIDQVYRDLMSKGAGDQGLAAMARGKRDPMSLPQPSILKAALRSKLKADKKDGGANIAGKSEWMDKVIVQPLWEVNSTLARFVLLAAFDDVVEGPGGELVRGKKGIYTTMKFDAWAGGMFSTVEHIAPRSRAKGWSPDLYQDDECERLGNLTLLPADTNASLSDRPWEHKKLLYAALSARTEDAADDIIAILKEQGVELSSGGQGLYSGQYLPHVHAISCTVGPWNVAAVEARGKALAELIWSRLAPWLDL